MVNSVETRYHIGRLSMKGLDLGVIYRKVGCTDIERGWHAIPVVLILVEAKPRKPTTRNEVLQARRRENEGCRYQVNVKARDVGACTNNAVLA